MNERIEKLVRQVEAAYIPRYDMWQMDSATMQEFVKLLVEECIEQCWTVSELESNGYVVSECSKKIRKHFGVE